MDTFEQRITNIFTFKALIFLTAAGSCLASNPHESGLPRQDYVEQETLLRNELLVNSNYSNKIRPAEKVEIQLRYNLLSINTLDIKTQTFSTSGWITAKWHDYRLTWDKATHKNISFMFDTESMLWRPELIIDNSVGFHSVTSIGVLHDSALLLRVRNDGEVMWEPPGIHTVYCEIDTTYYPFDGQKCLLDIASWSYNIDEVNLTHLATSVNLQDFMINGEWRVLNTFVQRSELVEEEETYALLQFGFHLHRRPFYYVINIMVPIGLTSVLSIIVFILPFESGEKVSYSLTVLLSYAVLMTIVADNMPSTSIHVSVLSVYLALILFVGCTSVILSVVNLHLYHRREDQPVPDSLRSFTRRFSPRKSKKVKMARPGSRQKILPVEYTDQQGEKQGDRQTAWQDKSTHDDLEDPSWSDVAIAMDLFLFKLYLVFVIVTTLLFFIVMTVGGYFVEPSLGQVQRHV